MKHPPRMRKCSVFISIWAPLLMVIVIAWTQTMISSYIVYFVPDAKLYLSWQYFEPMFVGLWEYVLEFVNTVRIIEEWDAFFNQILELSFSLDSLIDLKARFNKFKFSVLFLRLLLHIWIGFLEALTNISSLLIYLKPIFL